VALTKWQAAVDAKEAWVAKEPDYRCKTRPWAESEEFAEWVKQLYILGDEERKADAKYNRCVRTYGI
jgi:hypothetical protein